VGKLLLSYQLTDEVAVSAWVPGGDLAARTERTKTTVAELVDEFILIRQRGFSTDDQGSPALWQAAGGPAPGTRRPAPLRGSGPKTHIDPRR
jgi:DNA-binding IclR family transcriptional regulator